MIARLLRLGLIVIDVTCETLGLRSARLKMTIPAGPDAWQQNVLSLFAMGSRFVTGDACKYAVSLMIEGAKW